MLQAFPVIASNGQKKWEVFDWKVIEKLRNAVSQYRIKFALTHQILQFIFSADTLIPQDIKQLAQLILTPAQMLVFFRQWEKLCDREQATSRQQTDPLWGVTMQMPMGTGPFASGNAQLQCVTEVHHLSQILAYQAFLTIPDNMYSHAFTQVKQENTIYDHPDMNEGMKENMFKILAFENATEKTRKTLCNFPKNADVVDMIEYMDRSVDSQKVAYVATALQGATKKHKASKTPLVKCFNCGKCGHIRSKCTGTVNSKCCNKCKKDNHTTKNTGRRETLHRPRRPLARRHECKGLELPALRQPCNHQICHCRKLRSGCGNRSTHST
ncbi:endogenous retrovirus group K member 5 Gag polyprotein-like [Accipiter gentilis]|uniref:endogenous retrovirus group K member 5 Gag polyprotein-like n=1 Tax=Astur gentilis TaxID=8957 RepID=UPI00210FE2E6|nr:endogenous retrovirus group K member 5 Gag polyprotein-like [Accipiter gentilis]XP_049650078.1 endogenous retrovirus group K member 5 Gag polyprotein-like [Accipiter gentilis]XP_049650079.1 endogenous retrovirus group K member 5 Gag polyprotein-like [Accipiter gentilis]XP_049650080.1 endogenous retrovirus group K member 5 Gag polyprotein-like [Accipiter gentilis]